jgi:ABC-type proline/glycine betaine transport system substrate-binding protein
LTPQLDAVSHVPAGGTVVTITGAGFPSNTAADGVTQLLLGGVPCQVQSSNYSAIVCTTSAASSSATVAPAVKGWWPGLTGVNYDVWYNM